MQNVSNSFINSLIHSSVSIYLALLSGLSESIPAVMGQRQGTPWTSPQFVKGLMQNYSTKIPPRECVLKLN